MQIALDARGQRGARFRRGGEAGVRRRQGLSGLVVALVASLLALVPAPPAAAVTGPIVTHVPQPTAYYGQSVPISANATCPTASGCTMSLSYRSTPNVPGVQLLPSGGWIREDLALGGAQPLPDGSFVLTFAGTIPASTVTTTGLDYFLEASDGQSITPLPGTPGLPGVGLAGVATGYFHVQTVNPPVLAHVPPAFGYSDNAL